MAVSAYYWALRFKEQKQQILRFGTCGGFSIHPSATSILPELTMANLALCPPIILKTRLYCKVGSGTNSQKGTYERVTPSAFVPHLNSKITNTYIKNNDSGIRKPQISVIEIFIHKLFALQPL